MADWNDPATWREVSKHGTALKDLSKIITEAARKGEAHLNLDAAEQFLSILQGHQQTLIDVSSVAGKLVAYVTAAHEERIREIDAIHDLSKSLRQLTKTTAKLSKRVDKLERRAAKARAK